MNEDMSKGRMLGWFIYMELGGREGVIIIIKIRMGRTRVGVVRGSIVKAGQHKWLKKEIRNVSIQKRE